MKPISWRKQETTSHAVNVAVILGTAVTATKKKNSLYRKEEGGCKYYYDKISINIAS
jgi:hypothetical protein